MSKVCAVVYLAGGEHCRCVNIDRKDTIADVVDLMLAVQEDWEEIGSGGTRPLAFKSAADSSTDAARDRYGMVLVTRGNGAGGPASERLLPRDTRLDAPELAPLHAAWAATVMPPACPPFPSGG